MKYNISLDIATAKHRNSGTWKNKKQDWAALVDELAETYRTRETLGEYMKLTKDKQDDIKDVGGFVGGYLKGGKRRKDTIVHRQLVALDVDHAKDMGVWEAVKAERFAACMYTTHKHTPERPRYRVLIPLDRKVSPDEYEAIARVVANWFGINQFDDTTYQPNRLMYYPSTSRDAEYLHDWIDAPVLTADEPLDCLVDWTDPTTWPMSSRERERMEAHGGTGEAGNPEDKPGAIGAFCRAFGIAEAIAEFLPDVYKPCSRLGPNRYTFAGGSTSGGLLVYDNTFAYSHHATDPAGQRLSNAFDLVRLHKFGDLDADGRTTGGDITKAPSYKAMQTFCAGIKEVKREILAERSKDFEDVEDLTHERAEGLARSAAESDDWLDRLEMEPNGKTVKNTIANVVLILNNDERLIGCFGFNEFEQRETAVVRLPWDKLGMKYPRPLGDSDDAELRAYLESVYGLKARGDIQDGLTVVLRRNSYHPVKDYLDALDWDGVERLDTLYIDIFGADDNEYVRAVTRKTFVAAVSRVYNPGCKYDQVTLLLGDQGTGKSTSIALMGRDWFSDSVTTVKGKEAFESIQGSWLIELGEMASLKKAEVDEVKTFVAKREDRFRVAYGKRLEHFPRRCIFFGTSNEEDILRDATGNRRFWIINCLGRRGLVDVWDYLDDATVSQLWAEACERWEGGEPLFLNSRLEELARGVQDLHLERDDRAGLVIEYLNRLLPDDWYVMDIYDRRAWLADQNARGTVERREVCLMEVWAECFGNEPGRITRQDSFWLGRMMKSIKGWAPYGGSLRFRNYGKQKAYMKKPVNVSVKGGKI